MTKKEIERLDKKIELAFIGACFLVILLGSFLIVSQPQGEWQCTPDGWVEIDCEDGCSVDCSMNAGDYFARETNNSGYGCIRYKDYHVCRQVMLVRDVK